MMESNSKFLRLQSVILVALTTCYMHQRVLGQNQGSNMERIHYRIYDSLTKYKYEYAYQPGLAIVMIPNSVDSEDGIFQQYLACSPGMKTTPEDTCVWYINNVRVVYTRGVEDQPISTYFKGRNGCGWLAHLWIPDKPEQNITCEMTTELTRVTYRMTYIFYLYHSRVLVGHPLHFDNKDAEHHTKTGDKLELECKVDRVIGVYAIALNWYLESLDGELIDVNQMDEYRTISRSMDGDVRQSTLIVDRVTRDMFNSTYKCIARKIDIETAFATNASQYPLQAVQVGRESDMPLNHQNSRYIRNLTLNEYNVTQGGCNKTNPCQSFMAVRLYEHPATELSLALKLGLGILAAGVLVTVGVVLYLYRRRSVILSHIKHVWGVTLDVEDSSFHNHVTVFFSEAITEEKFLQNEFLVTLENKWKYRVHVLQRDADIGEGEADIRLSAIDSSQRCIFILTDGIFTDDWMLYALYCSLKHHQRVIIIKRSELNYKEFIGRVEKEIKIKIKDTERDEVNPVESAVKVAKIVDWNNIDNWKRLHYHLPLLIGTKKRHCVTRCLRPDFEEGVSYIISEDEVKSKRSNKRDRVKEQFVQTSAG